MIEEFIEKYPSKAEFCRDMGIKHQYLNQIEKGMRPIPPKLCLALAKKFGANPQVLRPDIYGVSELTEDKAA